MSDPVINVPGYQVSDLPETYQRSVEQQGLDTDNNGVLNSQDQEAIKDALGDDHVLASAATDNPELVLEVPGSSAQRDIRNAGERDRRIHRLSEDTLREATTEQRETIISAVAGRDLGGINANDERSILRALRTAPFHTRGAVLEALESGRIGSQSLRARLESNIDDAELATWLTNAAFLRPDFTATQRAAELNGAQRSEQTLLLNSMPTEQASDLVVELLRRGTLNSISSAHPNSLPWLETALSLSPIETVVDAVTAIGGLDAESGIALIGELSDDAVLSMSQSGAMTQLLSSASGDAQIALQDAVAQRIETLESERSLDAARAWVGLGAVNAQIVARVITASSDAELALLRRDDSLLFALLQGSPEEDRATVQRALLDVVLADANAHEAAKRLPLLGGFAAADVQGLLDANSSTLRRDHSLLRSLVSAAPEARAGAFEFVMRDEEALQALAGITTIGEVDTATADALIARIQESDETTSAVLDNPSVLRSLAGAAAESGALNASIFEFILEDAQPVRSAAAMATVGNVTADFASRLLARHEAGADSGAALRDSAATLRQLADANASEENVRRVVLDFVLRDGDSVRAAGGLVAVAGYSTEDVRTLTQGVSDEEVELFVLNDAFIQIAANAQDTASVQALLRATALRDDRADVIAYGLSAMGLSEQILREAFATLAPRALDAAVADDLYNNAQLVPFYEDVLVPSFSDWETIADYVYDANARRSIQRQSWYRREEETLDNFLSILPVNAQAREGIADEFYANRSVSHLEGRLNAYRDERADALSPRVSEDNEVGAWLESDGVLTEEGIRDRAIQFDYGYFRHDERQAFVNALRDAPIEDGDALDALQDVAEAGSSPRSSMDERMFDVGLRWANQGALADAEIQALFDNYASTGQVHATDENGLPLYDDNGFPIYWDVFVLSNGDRLALKELLERQAFSHDAWDGYVPSDIAQQLADGVYEPLDYGYYPGRDG